MTNIVSIIPRGYITGFTLLAAAVAYLLGSLNFAIIVSRVLYHKDIRTFGSGNAGMTNVLRTFGKGAAALTIIGDMGKGTVSVLFAKWLLNSALGAPMPSIAYIAAIAAMLGHLFPLYFKFKGGKGVSVAAGAIIAIEPIVVLILFVAFVAIFAFSRMVSLASIICAALYPIVTYLYLLYMGRDAFVCTGLSVIMAVLVIYMHRENIKRLCAGTEYKFGQKPKQ
ncbi:MAG: glycerol-3-phosphate 1-O-acyltransferase PlsY [Oscillospiraceae bacterium]